MEKVSQFVKKYSIFFILGFAFLTMFTYTFKELAFTNTGGIIYRCFVSAIILAFALFYFYKNYKSLKIRNILPVTIYLVAGLIAACATPAILHLKVSGKIYFESIATLFLNALSVFVFLDHLSNKHEEYEHANLVCYVVVWFVFFLTISTYVFQFKEIGKSFSEPDGWNYSVTSIFYTKTIYGYMLFIGSIFAIILMFNKNTLYFLFVPFYFAINSFISRNKTSLLFIILMMLVALILFTIKNRKTKQKELTITISVIGGLVTLFCMLTFIEPIRFGIFDKLYYFIKTSIFENGKTVIQDRFNKWGAALQQLNPFGYIFGYGEKLGPLVFNKYGTPLSDSAYLTTLGFGGIIKLSLLILLIFFVIRNSVKSDYSINKKILSITLIGCILLAGILEDDYIYGFNITSLFAAPVIYCSNKIIKNI